MQGVQGSRLAQSAAWHPAVWREACTVEGCAVLCFRRLHPQLCPDPGIRTGRPQDLFSQQVGHVTKRNKIRVNKPEQHNPTYKCRVVIHVSLQDEGLVRLAVLDLRGRSLRHHASLQAPAQLLDEASLRLRPGLSLLQLSWHPCEAPLVLCCVVLCCVVLCCVVRLGVVKAAGILFPSISC